MGYGTPGKADRLGGGRFRRGCVWVAGLRHDGRPWRQLPLTIPPYLVESRGYTMDTQVFKTGTFDRSVTPPYAHPSHNPVTIGNPVLFLYLRHRLDRRSTKV